MISKKGAKLRRTMKHTQKPFGTTGANTHGAQMREAQRQAQAIATLLGATA